MKKQLLLFILSLSPFVLPAQFNVYHPFPSDSATWDTQYNGYWTAGFGCITTFHYGMYGDTLIAGKSYSKIYRNNSPVTTTDSAFNMATADYAAGLREDTAKRIWAVHPYDTVEKLLYDFNLVVGDSFNYPFFFGTQYYYVTSVDSFFAGTSYRKAITLGGPGGAEQWVEGMGSLAGLLEREELASWWTSLICHEAPNVIYHSAPWYCHCDNGGAGVSELAPGLLLSAYPNPAGSRLNISVASGNGKTWYCALVAVDGKIVSERMAFRDAAVLDVSGLSPGLYQLVITDEAGGGAGSVKVAKE